MEEAADGGLCCCLTLLPTQRTPVTCDSPAVLSFLPLLNGLYLLFCSKQWLAGKCPILWVTAVTVEVTGSINLKQSPTWAVQPSKGAYPRETLLLQVCDALSFWERQRAFAVCQENRTAYGEKACSTSSFQTGLFASCVSCFSVGFPLGPEEKQKSRQWACDYHFDVVTISSVTSRKLSWSQISLCQYFKKFTKMVILDPVSGSGVTKASEFTLHWLHRLSLTGTSFDIWQVRRIVSMKNSSIFLSVSDLQFVELQ